MSIELDARVAAPNEPDQTSSARPDPGNEAGRGPTSLSGADALPRDLEGRPFTPALRELRALGRRWVAWRLEYRNGPDKKPTKPPVNPHTGGMASHSNPATWGTYEEAVTCQRQRNLAGIGFVLTDDDDIAGFDLDNCRDRETGKIAPWAQTILDLAETYAEVSPSGTGIHMLTRGKPPKATKVDAAGIEIYCTKRYLTITGDHVPGTPDSIEKAPHTYDALLARAAEFNARKVDEARAAELPRSAAQEISQTRTTGADGRPSDFFRAVNDAALANLSSWVPEIFPGARASAGTGAYRITSRMLGRDLQEDLPIAPNGIADWGVADMGDAREGRRTAIDIAMEYGDAGSIVDAAFWLCGKLGRSPNSLGWEDSQAGADVETAELGRQIADNLDAHFGGVEHRKDETWPMPCPIMSTLPAVKPFEASLLPSVLSAYVFDVADRQQSPSDFAAITALCGLATAVGNKVRICPKQNDDWTVVPNLWGALIGRPSAMKSPSLQAAIGPLHALQADLRRQWEKDRKEKGVDDALADFDAKDAKSKAAKAVKEGKRDEARELLAGLIGDDDTEKPCPRLIVNDATVEKLGELLNENPRGLLLVRDELPGFLARMEREECQSERAFYLEAFNGDGSFTYDRIGRGTIVIGNCTVSMIGGMQPSRLAPIVHGAISGTSNDGLIQRLQLAVWPDDTANWRWVDRRPDTKARDNYAQTFRRLYNLDLDVGERGHALLGFTSSAQQLFREWMEEIQVEARSGRLSSTLESHVLKMPKTVASLALIFALVEGETGAVGVETTSRALDLADYLRSHANRIYAAGQTLAEDGARLILERRQQLPVTFTARDVHQRGWAGLADRSAVAMAIELLVTTHHCREVPTLPNAQGGRPTSTYRWNPRLGEGGR